MIREEVEPVVIGSMFRISEKYLCVKRSQGRKKMINKRPALREVLPDLFLLRLTGD
jgi:uncharacterized protein Veg